MNNHEITKKILFEKEKNNAYHILDSKLAVSFAGFQRIKKDLNFVKNNALYLKDLQDSPEKFRLWFQRFLSPEVVEGFFISQLQNIYFSSIIIYGKCFSSAEGRKTSLNLDFIKDASAELIRVHENVIDTRNKYVAHAGHYESDIIIPVLVYEINNDKIEPPLVSYIGTYSLSMGNDIHVFIQLIDHILVKIDYKLRVLSEKILSEENIDSLKNKALEEKAERIKA